MKIAKKIACISLLLLIAASTNVLKAQIIFKGDFAKVYTLEENPNRIKKQYLDATIIFKKDSVAFLDKSMWNHLLYTVTKIEKHNANKYTWTCQDRIYSLDTKESTVTVTYPTTIQVDKYYGYFILDYK